MNDPRGTLERFGAAVQAGDREAVMSCFAPDATLGLTIGNDRFTLTGSEIGEALDALLTGFDNLRLTPTSRRVSKERVVEESVLSGDHKGVFAGVEPTGRRVRINVLMSATWGPDSTLESLWVEADTPALFAQIAGTDDVGGVTGGLIAIVRERHDGALRVTDETSSSSVLASASARTMTSRRRWVVAVGVLAVLLAGVLTWRIVSATGNQETAQAATNAASTQRVTPLKKAAPRRSSQRTQPKSAARPVIAAVNPKTAPRVQAGRQVVLNSDVLFGFDSAALTPAATAAVTRLAQELRDTKVSGTIQVNGYTDNVGGVAYDSALSQSRALAVARVLQSALVGRNVILVPQGFGDVNPIAPNTSEPGRARNRRVTIVLPVTH
jgi:outer membrane protein OmpA-like peptidoglycan-associated protein